MLYFHFRLSYLAQLEVLDGSVGSTCWQVGLLSGSLVGQGHCLRSETGVGEGTVLLAGFHGWGGGILTGLHVQGRPLGELPGWVGLLAVLWSAGATSWALPSLLVRQVAGCVHCQGSATDWTPQWERAMGCAPQLHQVRWGLRLAEWPQAKLYY